MVTKNVLSLVGFLVLCIAQASWTGGTVRALHNPRSLREVSGQSFLQHDDKTTPSEKSLPSEKNIHHQIKELASGASSISPTEMLRDDLKLVLDYFMPGKRPNIWMKAVEIALVALAISWFALYMLCIYTDDKCPKLHHWSGVDIAPRQDDPRISLMKPDVVLVFHNPVLKSADGDAEVPLSMLESVLVHGYHKSETFRRSHDLRRRLRRRLSRRWEQRMQRISGELSAKLSESMYMTSPRSTDDGEDDETNKECDRSSVDHSTVDEGLEDEDFEDRGVTLSEFRQALMQDICEHLLQKEFDVSVFSSVQNDCIFVCIAARSMGTIKRHLQCYGMKLQLQHEVVQTLKVNQPPDEVESSPPFIRYDRRFAENVFGEGKKDINVFHNFGAHSGRPVVISGKDRINIIHRHLTNHVNIDFAVAHNQLVQWYPAHAEARIAELQTTWARWSLLTDLTVRQPLSLIMTYFGSRIAFIFAWIGLFAKMLLCLLPVGVLWELMNSVAFESGWWQGGSQLGFSLAVVIWARLASNVWSREEEFLVILWDLKGNRPDTSRRPEFRGTLATDPYDGNKKSLQYPHWKYALRQIASWIVTLLFCGFNLLCVLCWIHVFGSQMSIAASAVQAIMIKIFTEIFNWMAEELTLAENHKLQQNFYRSYLKKMFIFQLVNQYSAFFYMAIKQPFTSEGCPEGEDAWYTMRNTDGCIHLIHSTLPLTLVILAALEVVQVFAATWLVKILLAFERWQITKKGEVPQVYSYVEEQSKYGPFRVREQIEVMTQLSLTLGYVLIFGCVAPRIVPLCFLIFMIQLRAGGILLTTAVNRTVPRMTVGIGPWNDVFYFLMMLGVIFSAFLLVQFGPLFKGCLLLTKFSGAFIYCLIVVLIWQCVDFCCPPSDSRSDLLENRRLVVEHLVMRLNEEKNFEAAHAKASKDYSPHAEDHEHGHATFVHHVINGDWCAVPKLIPPDTKETVSTESAKDTA